MIAHLFSISLTKILDEIYLLNNPDPIACLGYYHKQGCYQGELIA